jgi:hypothetical protein
VWGDKGFSFSGGVAYYQVDLPLLVLTYHWDSTFVSELDIAWERSQALIEEWRLR